MRKKKFTEKHLKKTYFPWNHSQGGGYVLKKILPSMVTVWALCMGLTALSFSFEKMCNIHSFRINNLKIAKEMDAIY